jgi:hypothetical protein
VASRSRFQTKSLCSDGLQREYSMDLQMQNLHWCVTQSCGRHSDFDGVTRATGWLIFPARLMRRRLEPMILEMVHQMKTNRTRSANRSGIWDPCPIASPFPRGHTDAPCPKTGIELGTRVSYRKTASDGAANQGSIDVVGRTMCGSTWAG